jgi:arylsulfatase A
LSPRKHELPEKISRSRLPALRIIIMKNTSLPRALIFCWLLCLTTSPAPSAERTPNIIIMMADDLGYGDLGCYGHPTIRTPNLDRMAAEGLRFTDFYAGANLCTPSRAALLTGRHPIRSGMAGGPKRHVLYPNAASGLPTNEVTIARALKSVGYATACIGKWHLGDRPEFLPNSHGFDFFFGLPYSNDMNPTSPKVRRTESGSPNPDYKKFDVPLMRNLETLERPVDQTTLTRRYTEEAIRFITENQSKPFFIYLPHTFPHVPLFASKKFRGKSARGLYGDTVEELDWSVGEVLAALRRLKLAENTLVIFTSDNGPWLNQKLNGGSAGLLRDGKAGTWEGGHRVPAIAWWPGKIKPGRITSELVSSLDLFPTCARLAGAPGPTDRPLDGANQTQLLLGTGPSTREVVYYYYGDQLYAVRKGAFKAEFITHDGYSPNAPEKHDPPLVFHLPSDPSEQFNVATNHPKVAADLQREAEQHRRETIPGKPQF